MYSECAYIPGKSEDVRPLRNGVTDHCEHSQCVLDTKLQLSVKVAHTHNH